MFINAVEKIGTLNFLKDFDFSGLGIEMNTHDCNRCHGIKKCSTVKGRVIQPCPDCEKKDIDEKSYEEKAKTFFYSKLDRKFIKSKFSDYIAKTQDQRNMLERAKDYAYEYENGKWCLLMGGQGTGKTMIKNCILR